MQALIDDGNQHRGAYGNLDLPFVSALALTQKRLDAQVPLDPSEEQFGLPAFPVQVGYQLGLQCKVVGQKREVLSRTFLDHHPAQDRRIGLAGIELCQYSGLIAEHVGGGIERLDSHVHVDTHGLVDVQRTCQANQMLRRIGVDSPWLCRIRVGQPVARERLATKVHVIEPLCLSAQVEFDVATRLSMNQLRERNGEELVQARELLHFVVAPMSGDAAGKRAQRQVRQELPKNEFAPIHCGPSLDKAMHKSDTRRSNRDQTKHQN